MDGISQIDRRRPTRTANRAGLLVLVVVGAFLVQASPGTPASYLGERPVRFDPPHATPFQQVRGVGFDCGDGWGPGDLFGMELTALAEPPTEDEGVSLILVDIEPVGDNAASGTFTIPETSPGDYYAYYLCARGLETRVFLAEPTGGQFRVDPLHPRQTAPPAEPVGPASAGVLLALLLLAGLALAALWRIARVQTKQDVRPP